MSIYTFVLTKDCSQIDFDVAHLYEHWFIDSFLQSVAAKLQMEPGFIGYVSGETFKNKMFIEAWFYDKRIADCFQQFVRHEHLVDESLPVVLGQCAAEDRVQWSIPDPVLLHAELQKLIEAQWEYVDDQAPSIYSDEKPSVPSPVSIHKSARSYRSIIITSKLADASLLEQALLMRLYVLLMDIIGRWIQQKGWYEIETSGPRGLADTIHFTESIVLPRGGLTNGQITRDLTTHIRQIDVARNMPYITAHFAHFAEEPIWKGRIRGDLHHVSVVASNTYIASIATEENIRQLLQKLTIQVNTVPYTVAQHPPY